MLKINTGFYPDAEKLLSAIAAMACYFGYREQYAPGGYDRGTNEPIDGKLTTSNERWEMMRSFDHSYPEELFGRVSWGWLSEALNTTPMIVAQSDRIKSKLLLLQAGDDQVVVPDAAKQFCSSITNSSLLIIPDAQHVIFMEKDSIRDQALEQIEQFFEGTIRSK
jgi:lysophospholipase